MKKSYYIIAFLALVIFIGALFYLTRFNEASLIARDGFFVSGEDMDEVLLNENKVAKTGNVKLKKISSNDTFYSNLDKIYVGEEKKTEVNTVYPMYINNGLGVVNLDTKSILINNKFEKFDTYENFTVTGGKLYNFGDYEQADYETYILLQLANGTYINLLPMTITTNSGLHEVPENSVINFQEDYFNYYSYSKSGKMVYGIVDGINLNDVITFGDYKYTYERLLIKLEKYEPPVKEEVIVEEEPEKEDYIIVIKDEPKSSKYIAPKVKVTSFTPNVYSAKASLSISDPSRVIVGGINFQFYVNDKVYLRKTFVSGGGIEVVGLVPNQSFKIVGSYKYYNEESKKMEKTFFEQEIRTLGVDILDPIDLTFENGEVYPNKIELLNFGISSDIKSETTKGVNKAIINIGDDQYSISTGLLQEILQGKLVTYTSPAKLLANTAYDYDIEFLDAYGNKIKIRNNTGSSRTSKNKPTASVKIASSQVNQVVTQAILKNVDSVRITHYKYIIFDNLDTIVKEGNLDSEKETNNITLRDLNPNTTYNIQILGTYDVEDGKGTQVDQVMGEGKFTTAPLNSLGFYRVVASTTLLESDKATISSRIDIANVSPILMELLNTFSVAVTDEAGTLLYAHTYKDEELESLRLGEDFIIELTNLQSVTTYNIDYAAVVKQGSIRESINVLCSFKNFKTYKRKAEVQIRNEFVTGTFIDFDVRIVDIDGAIESPRALLEVRDEGGRLVGKEYLGINQDYVQLTYDRLDTNKNYTFTYYVEEYNIGFNNQTFQSDYHLLEKIINTTEGVKADIELVELLRQVEGNNLFNIQDYDRIRKEGNTPYKEYDIKNNTVMFGAKNGYVNHSYFIPEAKDKEVTMTLKARYNPNTPNRAKAYIGKNYARNMDFELVGLNDEWTSYKFTFISQTNYIGFVVDETSNQNLKTTVDFKDIQIVFTNSGEESETTDDIEKSYHQSGKIFTNTQMKAGNEVMPNYNNNSTMTGNTGNGYARITRMSDNTRYNFTYTGNVQTFTVPTTGKYSVQLWGARGYSGGKGGYTYGEIELTKGNVYYIYVGQQGQKTVARENSFNGGGGGSQTCNNINWSGGGATDIRLVNGAWYDQTSLESRIMVAAGGGATGWGSKGGGDAGGLVGYSGKYLDFALAPGTGGTQTTGGLANGTFGIGGNATADTACNCSEAGGGGGGWYGGGGSNYSGYRYGGGGGGGSSYISGHSGCIAYHKRKQTSADKVNPENINPYIESGQLRGYFNINMYDLRDELVNQDWYVRIYRKDVLVETHQYELTENIMENISKNYSFDKNVYYSVKVSVKVRDRFYDIASVEFTTENEIRAIRTTQDFFAMHPNGKYIVLNDLDFVGNTSIYSYFYGEIDFQGHTIKRYMNVGARIIENTAASAIIKNVVIEAHINNTNSREWWYGLITWNRGVVDNAYVDIVEVNQNPNSYDVMLVYCNYGVIQNFVIKETVPMTYIAGGGLATWSNEGVMRNGYIYGENIYAYFQNVEKRSRKDVGGFTGQATNNSRIECVYSLISVDKNNTYGTGDRENIVGNIVGYHAAGYIGNAYSVELPDRTNTNILTQDPNIGGVSGIRSNKLYYSSDRTYGTTRSQKVSKLALYDTNFQNDILNKYDGFNVDDYVEVGYFPQLRLNDCMPKQEWIALPKITDADLVDVTSVEEVQNNGDSAVVKLHINNPSSEKIERVTITNIGTVNILEQKDLYGKTDLTIELLNPTAYKSIYYLDTLTMKPAYGGNYDKIYEKNERSINIDLYCPIRTLTDWKMMVSNPSQNYALMEDLDFFNASMTQYLVTSNFTAKFDGRGHTIKNITINSGNGMFTRISGGTLKNLNIKNYKKTNSTYRNGFIYETNNNSVIDNVHMDGVQIYGNNFVGGIVGYSQYTTFRNSSVTNFKPSFPAETEDLYVGGLVGYADYLFIENCFTQDVDIVVTDAISTMGIGGLAGRLVMGTVNNAYATGRIECNSVNVGGLIGYDTAYVSNVWTYVDILANQDYVGGIIGFADNNMINNTLSLGAVYSSFVSDEGNNVHRTTGNVLPVVQNNYAWEKQKYYGYVTGESSSEILLTTAELEEKNTYIDLIGFGELDFDYSQIQDNIIPKLINPDTSEPIPGQKDVQLRSEKFDVLSYQKEVTASNALIHIVIDNPDQYTIQSIKFNSLTVSNDRYVNQRDDGTTIVDMMVTPDSYFDSYIMNEVNYLDENNEPQKYPKIIKFELQFFKPLAKYDDWTHISTTTPENYRLSGDIDFTDKVNVRIGVVFARLEGLVKPDGTNYVIKNYTKTGITKAKTTLIRKITTTLKNVDFDNIDLESTQNVSYINVIYLCYAEVNNVNFTHITTKTKGSYSGPIGWHRGMNFNNVTGSYNVATGADYVGGIMARTYNRSSTDVSGEYNEVTSTGRYCGGLVGYRDYRNGYNVYRYTGRHMTVKGVNDIGTLYGYGGAYYSYAYDSTVTSTGNGEYVGGVGGRTSFESENYNFATNITINATANYVGGLYGWGRYVYNSEVIGCTINQTNTGRNYVGGAFGYQDGYTHSNIGVINTTINNSGNYTGGITGRLNGGGNLTYSFTSNVTINGKSYIGGVAGSANTARLYQNLTNVSISATGDYVGGAFGYISTIDDADTTYSAYVYEVLILNSKILGNNYVGGFVGATIAGKQLTPKMFFNIIIVADCNTTATSNIYVGAVNGQDTRVHQNIQLTTFRIYKNNRLNGVYVSSLSLPNIATQYFADQTNLATQSYYTNLNFHTNRWSYTKLSSGYFPKVKKWSTGNQDVSSNQRDLLRPETVVNFSARRLMDAPPDHRLPDLKIYSSGINTLNLEFSEADGYTYFEVLNGGTKVVDENINERTYTIDADYKSEIEVVVSDGRNTKKYQVKENEYRQLASTYGKKYAYIYGGKLKGNISAPKDKFIHVYNNFALTDDLRVYDFDLEEFVEDSYNFETVLEITRPLFKFEYNDTEIDTYYNYSVVHKKSYDLTYDNQLFVKNNTIQIVDKELDSYHNSLIIDEYAEKEYVSVLGLDGNIYDLKSALNKPSNFSNKGILFMTNNLNSQTSAVVLMYKTGKVVVFDYRTGKEIEQEKANEDVSIFDYFKENFKFNTPLTGSETTNSYQEALELEKALKETPIDTDSNGKYVMRDEETKEQIKKSGEVSGGGSITREYITYYNPVRDDYDVVDIESILEGDEEEVVTENNKIYTSNALVEYYMKPSIFEEVLGNVNALYIFGGILIAIITALGLFLRNAKLLKVSDEKGD